VGRLLASDTLLAVNGGTQRYQNARGQTLFDFTNADQITITFELIPSSPGTEGRASPEQLWSSGALPPPRR
jgi:hypothetical protein